MGRSRLGSACGHGRTGGSRSVRGRDVLPRGRRRRPAGPLRPLCTQLSRSRADPVREPDGERIHRDRARSSGPSGGDCPRRRPGRLDGLEPARPLRIPAHGRDRPPRHVQLRGRGPRQGLVPARRLDVAKARLRYYAERFDTVEVDSPYYHLPDPAVTANWAQRTPPEFVFHVKAHSSMTWHEGEPTDDAFAEFRARSSRSSSRASSAGSSCSTTRGS